MTERPYEIYVSSVGIRVCSAGWDQAYTWDIPDPILQDCWGHNTREEIKNDDLE